MHHYFHLHHELHVLDTFQAWSASMGAEVLSIQHPGLLTVRKMYGLMVDV